MIAANRYPTSPQKPMALYILALKYFFSSFFAIWPLSIVMMLFFLVNQYLVMIQSIAIQRIFSVLILFLGYLTINLALWKVHQVFVQEKAACLRDKYYWKALCLMFICMVIPFIALQLLVVHLDLSQNKLIYLALILSSLLIIFYLLSIFSFPLLFINRCSLWRAVSISVQYVKKNWTYPVIIYTLLMSMVLTVLPSSLHMAWLSQYHLVLPVSFLSISFFLTVAVNIWLLIVNDYKIRCDD